MAVPPNGWFMKESSIKMDGYTSISGNLHIHIEIHINIYRERERDAQVFCMQGIAVCKSVCVCVRICMMILYKVLEISCMLRRQAPRFTNEL